MYQIACPHVWLSAPTLRWITLPPIVFFLAIMRFLFFLVLLANVAVLAFGQGFMGTPPSEEGRTPRLLSERNQHIVEFGQARLAPAQSEPA